MIENGIVSPEAVDLYGRVAAGGTPLPADAAALSQLVNLQLLRNEPQTGQYAAADPAYIGARLLAAFHDEAAKQLKRAAEFGDCFDGLKAAYAGRPSHDGGTVEYLQGAPVINARLGPVLASCRDELLAAQPGGPRRPEILATVRKRDLANLQRGIRMRTLYSEDARGGRGMHKWVGEMTAAGAEIRTTDHDYPRMIIIDRRVAVIPGADDLTARIIHDAGVAGFLADHLFGSYWAQARPWVGVPDPQQFLDRERQERVMALMDDGMTLAQIAERLQISQRRLATIVAELKVAYGVTSLFQLGSRWRAARQSEAASVSTLAS